MLTLEDRMLALLKRSIEPDLDDAEAEYQSPLSDEWQEEAKQILSEYEQRA